MFNIYENERYLIKSCLDLAVIIVCFLFIYITYLFLENIDYLHILNINTDWNWTIVLIELFILCKIYDLIDEYWPNDILDKLSINLLHLFRYIKPYNETQFNHLYLNQDIDIDFIVNKIIPLSVYKDNEKIHNHITVDEMLNMRSAFDESVEFNV